MTTTQNTADLKNATWAAADEVELLACQVLEYAAGMRAKARTNEPLDWADLGDLNHVLEQMREIVR